MKTMDVYIDGRLAGKIKVAAAAGFSPANGRSYEFPFENITELYGNDIFVTHPKTIAAYAHLGVNCNRIFSCKETS